MRTISLSFQVVNYFPLLSSDMKKNQKMLQNIWQCQVRAWTIVHWYLKYCTCKPPSNWETRDIPFTVGLSSLNFCALQCCQTMNQISIRLHMKASPRYLHSHINQDGNVNMKLILFMWSFFNLWPMYPVAMSSWKEPNLKNLSRMEDSNVKAFCILMAALTSPTMWFQFLWSIFQVFVQSTGWAVFQDK